MQDFHSIVYSKNVIEFVAVAKEFCEFMENMGGGKKRQAVAGIQKFIPLVYLKGVMLPHFDLEVSGLSEDFVTEDDYNFLFAGWEKLMGEYDEYLEVFDEAMQYSEARFRRSGRFFETPKKIPGIGGEDTKRRAVGR